MPVLALVIDRRAPLHDLLDRPGVEYLTLSRCPPDFLGKRQRRSAIAIGHAHQYRPRLLVERQVISLSRLRTHQQRLDTVRPERMEGKHTRTRQKRGIELKRWVFCCRAHQNHCPVFHDGQKRVLLRPVETVNLIDEQQCLPTVRPSQPRRFEHFFQIGHTGEDCRYLFEGEIGFSRQQPGNGCFSSTGRSPEDHAAQRARPDHARQRSVSAVSSARSTGFRRYASTLLSNRLIR